MKKILLFLITLSSLFALTSCGLVDEIKGLFNPYEEEAGVYNLYEMTGDLDVSMYEYYRITLNADGTCLVESKGVNSSQVYSSTATFSIENGKISVVTRAGSASVTEIYDYVDGEIHMPTQTIQGITFSAKFKRDE